MALNLANSRNELRLSERNGAVKGLFFERRNFLEPAAELFSLGMRLGNGDLKILCSSDFTNFIPENISENGKNFLCLRYSAHPSHPGLTVAVRIAAGDRFFHFRPSVAGIAPETALLEWIDAPQICPVRGASLFWPRTEGILIDKPELREKTSNRYHILGFLDRSSGGYYPGVCQMQFISAHRAGRMLYFGAHDRSHGTKGVEFAPDGDGRVRLSLQTFCGTDDPRGYESKFDYVLCAGEGDWMDACRIYREWIASDPMLPERGEFPALVKESPVVMIHPVRGNGDDKGKMEGGNEYFPYSNALPAVRKYARAFDSKILSLLMHWEGTAPWAPPYVWPPFGGEALLLDYLARLHEEGHYLGVYCSGTAWTQKSCIVPYSREKECEERGLRRHMIRGPRGEIDALTCNGENSQRLGFDMCIAEEWPRETVKAEIMKLANAGIDYAQFFDQNLGGSYHPCYSREHAHPPVPGAWQTGVMKSLLRESMKEIRSSGSRMILGCEAAAADVFLGELPFNDQRPCFTWEYGIPVPGYQFVFHEYINNFMGNQGGISFVMDCRASPENLLWRTAYAFNAGDLLSIVLRDNGLINWGWIAPWDMDAPDQESEITLIRNLNAARKKYPRHLLYGRMEKPCLRLRCSRLTLHLARRNEQVPSCFHSAWLAPDGARMEFLTNFLPDEQTVGISVPAGTAVRIGEKIHRNDFELTLAALNTTACIFPTLNPNEKKQ